MSVHVGLEPHPGVEPAAEEVVAGAAEEEVVGAVEEAAAVVEEEAEAVTETEAGETEKEGLVATEASSKHVEKIVGDVTAKTRDIQRCWHYS